MQFGPYLWQIRKNSFILEEIWVGEHDGDVGFLTGSRNMAVSRMPNKKYAIWPLLVAESPMNSAMGQTPCSTKRISC